MTTILQTLLPIFAIIGIGFAAVRTGYLQAAGVAHLGAVVIRIALPALIFLAFAGAAPTETLSMAFLLAYALGSLGTMAICMTVGYLVFRLSRPGLAVVGLGVSMANSGFMGFPIATALLGEDAATRLLAHCLVVENILVLPLGLLLLALAGQGDVKQSPGRIVVDLVRSPLLLAIVAGLGFSLAGLTLPDIARDTFMMLARISGPLAVLVIGGMLASLTVQGSLLAVGLIVAGKLVVHPLLVWASIGHVPGIDPLLASGGVLFAAMPMITIFPLLAARIAQGPLGAYGLMVATLGSFLTIPLVILALELT